MMKRIGIFGTSGMAREAADIAYDLGLSPLYVARNEVELEALNSPAEAIVEADVGLFSDIPFVIGIAEGTVRKKIFESFRDQLVFRNLIHSSVSFGYLQRDKIEGQQGIIVCAGVRFTNNIQVGDFCIFNQNATIAHDVAVGNFTHISPGCTISGNVIIGNNCWIGAGSVINQGSLHKKIYIGDGTTIGSGAVVIRSCESNAVYAGVPAKRIK